MHQANLKVTHPLAWWRLLSFILIIFMIILMAMSLTFEELNSRLVIKFSEYFAWLAAGYVISVFACFGFSLAPRFISFPAGRQNLERLQEYSELHAKMSMEVNMASYYKAETTYQDLKYLQKVIAKRMIHSKKTRLKEATMRLKRGRP